MKFTLSLCCLVLAVVTQAYPQPEAHSREKRAFKDSVANRIAHGFGKRTALSLDLLPEDNSRYWMAIDEVAGRIMTDYKLARTLAQKIVDSNGDGLITSNELLQFSRDL